MPTSLLFGPAKSSKMRTSCSGCANGSGRNSTPYTTLKIATFAPIPSTSVSTATIVNPGDFSKVRAA